jgi:VWFA-related protein
MVSATLLRRVLPIGLLLAAPFASRGAAQGQPPPPLKSGVSLVSLDFLAVGRDGQPVADLKAEEVALKIGGRARPLAAFNLIEVGADAAPSSVSPLPPPFGSNVQTRDTRAFVLVVDNDSFRVGTERALREAADTFLDSLAPTDRVALVTMPYGGTRVNLTTEQEAVRASLAGIIGQAPTAESAEDMACRSRRTLDSLRGLFEGLVGNPSAVTVAFFSASMVGPNEQVIRSQQTVARCALLTETFTQVGAAAADAGARLYIVEPVGIANQIAGLDHLAGVTGGVRLALGRTGDSAFTRMLRETSAFYRAAFEPEPSQRTGNVHRVELKVSRPDVTVRVRPSIRIDRGDGKGAATPKDLLRRSTVVRDLPLRVTGFASRESGQKNLKVVAVAEPADGVTPLASAALGLVDSAGKLIAQALVEANELKAGQPVIAAMLAPPGTYRLRFAATDAAGRIGTSDYELAAELRQAGPLQLSGLVLGLSRGGFVPRLQFSREPVAIAYLELYGGTPGQPVSAVFELARTLNGPPMVSMPGTLSAVGDHYSATAPIPIGTLSPGDYIVRATVGAVGEPSTRVERTLRKVVE